MEHEGDAALVPWRFAGQYHDAETGLHYNRHRYYDPETEGFISPDPIGLAGGLRVYGYVEDPLGWMDPLGLAKQSPGGCQGGDGGSQASPDFVVGPGGDTVATSQARMRAGFEGAGFPSQPTSSPGLQHVLPDGSRVRTMEPTSAAPRRASFENMNGQPIDPFTGKPPQPPKGMTNSEGKAFVRSRTHVEQT